MLPTNALIEIIREASRAEIMPRFRALNAADIKVKSRADDLVTEADLATERRITEAVVQLMPEAAIVGEEAVAADPSILSRIADAETCVIVDPIDGTWNYAHGSSTFGVILTVTHKGETVFGVLYNPVNDDWIEAERGGGAWFCRQGRRERLTLPASRPISESHAFTAPYLLPPDRRAEIWGSCRGWVARVRFAAPATNTGCWRLGLPRSACLHAQPLGSRRRCAHSPRGRRCRAAPRWTGLRPHSQCRSPLAGRGRVRLAGRRTVLPG